MPASALWFLNSVAPVTPGRNSVSFPWGTDNGGPQRQNLFSASDPGDGSFFGIGFTSLAQTARQSYHVHSAMIQIGAQTIPAQDWTIECYGTESNNAANQFPAVAIYIWRSGTGKVATIYDSQAELGVEFTASENFAVAGASVTPQDGDWLVVEHWVTGTQSMATAYSIATQQGGNTSTTQFKVTPANTLYLQGETPPVAAGFNPLALAGD